MRRILLILGLLLSIHSYGAVNPKQNNTDGWEKRRELCNGGAEIAETVMDARQRGVSIRDIYSALSMVDEESRDTLEVFVVSAYEVPIANSSSEAKVITLEFVNQFFKACMDPS